MILLSGVITNLSKKEIELNNQINSELETMAKLMRLLVCCNSISQMRMGSLESSVENGL